MQRVGWYLTASHSGSADRAQELCESRGGCPGLPVPNKPFFVDVNQHFEEESVGYYVAVHLNDNHMYLS